MHKMTKETNSKQENRQFRSLLQHHYKMATCAAFSLQCCAAI